MGQVDFTINNDEIERISKRIRELQDIKTQNGDFSEEQLTEYQNLFKIKDLLIKANQIKDPNKYVVIDGMRIFYRDIKKFYSLAENVNVDDLDLEKPLYLGEFIPGTKTKCPRQRGGKETILEYEEYLEKYYKSIGYDLGVVQYYPYTTVPKPRNPYPHEMYYSTENGYELDSKNFGRKNKYYLELVKYLKKEYDKEVKKISKESIDNLIPNNAKKAPISRTKVVKSEMIPIDLLKRKKKKSPIEELDKAAKSVVLKYQNNYPNYPNSVFDVDSLERTKPNMEVIRNDFKNIFESSKRKKVINHEKVLDFSLVERARNILKKKSKQNDEKKKQPIDDLESLNLDVLPDAVLDETFEVEKCVASDLLKQPENKASLISVGIGQAIASSKVTNPDIVDSAKEALEKCEKKFPRCSDILKKVKEVFISKYVKSDEDDTYNNSSGFRL